MSGASKGQNLSPRGRKGAKYTGIDPDDISIFRAALERGATEITAANEAGFSYSAFQHRKARGKVKLAEALAEGIDLDSHAGAAVNDDVDVMVARACVEGREVWVQARLQAIETKGNIENAKTQQKDWSADAWLLERMERDRFGPASKQQLEVQASVGVEDPRKKLDSLLGGIAARIGADEVDREPSKS